VSVLALPVIFGAALPSSEIEGRRMLPDGDSPMITAVGGRAEFLRIAVYGLVEARYSSRR